MGLVIPYREVTAALCPARRFELGGNRDAVHALAGLLAVGAAAVAEVFVVEREHLFPTVHRGVLAIAGAVHCEKAVAGSFVHVELVVLIVLLQFFLGLGYIGGGWPGVILAE